MIVALLWTGCKAEREDEPTTGNPFSLSICLPAEEVHAARMCSHRRVMGDPGTQEQFALPRYIYVIIMKKAPGEGEWSLWEVITETPSAEDWTKKRYGGGLATTGDSIYQYNIEFHRLLATPRFDGRVYIIASAVGLTFDKALNASNLNSQSAVESLKFASMMPADENDSIQANLQHIYTTPCNYAPDGVNYYGAFKNEQRVPHLDMVLYHVAAKVDINWNVADTVRIKADPTKAVRLTTMKAWKLFADDAYCFKPMENVYASVDPLPSGAEVSIVTPTDESLWWEGRSYFYTIPYTTTKTDYENYFPLQMQMVTNETGTYTPTIYMQIDKSSPFVPWLRATFNIRKPLSGSETKKVDLPTP